MGIYLPNMEMPTGNDELRLIIRSNGQVIISHETYFDETEAIPIPPHGDLIDRYALLNSMEMNGNPKTVSDHINNIVRFLDALMDAPAIIPAEPPKEEA